MVSPSNAIGIFVHSALDYIAHQRAHNKTIQPQQILAKRALLSILHRLVPKHIQVFVHGLHPQKLERVKECWRYIIELIELADEVWFEYDLGISKPDIIIIHKNHIYIIEIKTFKKPFTSLTKMNGWQRTKLIKQTRKSAPLAMQKFGKEREIHLYALFFNTSISMPFTPTWYEVSQQPGS